MDENFLLWLKSTIDKLGVDLAGDLGFSKFLDIDDRSDYATTLVEGNNDAVIWRVMDYSETHVRGRWAFTFVIGTSLHTDVNNTKAMRASSIISQQFRAGCTLDIKDYTGAVESERKGLMSIIQNSVDPALSDGMQGFRWSAITALVTASAL